MIGWVEPADGKGELFMRSIRLGVPILVLVVALGTIACSSEETSEPVDGGGTTSEPAAEDGTLTISGLSFSPSSVVTGPGGALTIVNEDGVSHTFTMDDGSLDEPIGGGETVEVTITAAGSFHCEIHPSMTGSVSLG
jgi:plastocyanin